MSITPPRDSVALAALPRLRVSTSLPVLAKDKLEHASTFEKILNSEFRIMNGQLITYHRFLRQFVWITERPIGNISAPRKTPAISPASATLRSSSEASAAFRISPFRFPLFPF